MKHRSYAYGLNHWLLEPDLCHILKLYWDDYSNHEQELSQFGILAGGKAYEIADYVDRTASPIFVMHNLDGERVDQIRLNPAQSDLLQQLAWINRSPYEGGSWHHHFALGFLLADPGLYCTLTVTNQTVHAIYKYAPEHNAWIEPLLSGSAWGATWMTETQGGSDLGANLTLARRENGDWKLYGEHKYFASNVGLADLALVTARPEGGQPGPKGIALFLVPRLNSEGNLNFLLRRLKEKSATRAVPTGEVEFPGSQAYLVGEMSEGIYYTLENLTVSRLANSIGAMGLSRKAHLEALMRVHARSAFNKRLIEHPLVRWDLTDLEVRNAAGLSLVFRAIQQFDEAWKERPPYDISYHYARFLSHLAKNRTAEHAAESTRLVMELFGGLGFMDECVVSRLHREALVTAIWEGTSNIQSLDMLEAMHKKGAHEPFLDEFNPLLIKLNLPEARLAQRTIETVLSDLSASQYEEAQWRSKASLQKLADATQVALLFNLAEKFGDRYAKLATLYANHFLRGDPYPNWVMEDRDIWDPLPQETYAVD